MVFHLRRSDPGSARSVQPSILFLTQYFPPERGAAQTRLGAVVAHLAEAGHEVKVVTGMPNHPTGRIFPKYRGKLYCRELWNDVPVHRVWIVASVGSGVRRIINQLSFAITCFAGMIPAGRADILFVESPPFFLPVAALVHARIRKVPVVVNVADLWLDAVHELGFLRPSALFGPLTAIEKRVYRTATAVTAVTEGVRGRLLAKGVAPEKLLFLPNGADLKTFSRRRRDESVAGQFGLGEEPVILYAGTHGYVHGLDVVLHAAKLLEDAGIRFLLVGDGSEKARLEHLAGEMGLSNVHFVAPVAPEMVARLLSWSVAGLVTVRKSAAAEYIRSAKALPTMAAGRPVIYSGDGEGARLVAHAQAGVVVPPEDPVALARAVRELCDHPELAGRLGANGRAFAERTADWAKLIDEWLYELYAVLERKKEAEN